MRSYQIAIAPEPNSNKIHSYRLFEFLAIDAEIVSQSKQSKGRNTVRLRRLSVETERGKTRESREDKGD
jgi:hypothetical protein